MAPELGKPIHHLHSSQPTSSKHHVHEPLDPRFRSAARLLQALWREDQDLPIGSYVAEDGKRRKLGSRISEAAGRSGGNFLTPEIAHTARREAAHREIGALIDADRLATNLLSSMPLAFNLLAPWGHSLERASSYLIELLPAFTGSARQLLFEHSPGRGDPKYTGDFTAFDALIRYSDGQGRNGFVAFEIKYSESMREPMPELKPRYDELSEASGLFTDPAAALRTNPLQQLTREHLLAQSMIDHGLYDEGYLVVIAPALNYHVRDAAGQSRPRARTRIGGWTERDDDDSGEETPDHYIDLHVLGALVGHLIRLTVGDLPPCVVVLATHLMRWTDEANGPHGEEDRDRDNRPYIWNSAFFDFLGILCVALPHDNVAAMFLEPMMRFKDDSFHEAMGAFLRGFDRATQATDTKKPENPAIGDHIAVKSGFSSGYGGTGPACFSITLQLLLSLSVEIDEWVADGSLIDRLDQSALTVADVENITTGSVVRPSRWSEYILDHHQRLGRDGSLWREFPPVIPFAIVDGRIMDLACEFCDDPDGNLLRGYRRLEDVVRERTGLTESHTRLFSRAFHGKDAILTWDVPDESERTGRANLFAGTYMAYRNHRAHQEAPKSEMLAEFLLLNQLYRMEREAAKAKVLAKAP